MAFTDIVSLGKAGEQYGLVVRENPAFGTGRVGGHAPGSYHYAGKAIDITAPSGQDLMPAFAGGNPIPWQQRTGELSYRFKQLQKQIPGITEVYGPGDPGHSTHVHVAVADKTNLSPEQLQWAYTGRWKTPEGKLMATMPGVAQEQPQQPQQQQTRVGDDQLAEYLNTNTQLLSQLLEQQKNKTKTKEDEQPVQEIVQPSLGQQFLASYLSSAPTQYV